MYIKNNPTRYEKFKDLLLIRGYESYDHYLNSEQWTRFNKWYRQTSLPQRCLVCNTKEFQLHHWTYERVGCEYPCDTIPLCGKHHLELHRYLDKTGEKLHNVEIILQKCFGMENNLIVSNFRPFLLMREGIKRNKNFCKSCQRILPDNCHSKTCKQCQLSQFNIVHKFPAFWGHYNFMVSWEKKDDYPEINKIYPVWEKYESGKTIIYSNIRVHKLEYISMYIRKMYDKEIAPVKLIYKKKNKYNKLLFSNGFPREDWMYWAPDGKQFNKKESSIHVKD